LFRRSVSSNNIIEDAGTSSQISRFDAENATSTTIAFLDRLGYKGKWLPLKVSLDGELYVVEMMLQKKTAKVQINSSTKDIKEYEFQETDTESKSPLKSKGPLFLVAIIGIAVLAAKLLGVF
jgi:hypothetical protein